MSPAFVRSYLSIALLSSYSSTAPLNYKDPQTWFQADEQMISTNQTDSLSSAAFNVVVSPSVIPTYDYYTSPSLPPVPIIAETNTTLKTTVVPVTKIPTTLIPIPVSPSTSTVRTFNIGDPVFITSTIPPLPSISNAVDPAIFTSTRPQIISTLNPQDRPAFVSLTNTGVPMSIAISTSTSTVSPRDNSPIISSANSVVVHCSPNGGITSVSADTGNGRTSAVVQPGNIFSNAVPINERLVVRTTTQLPPIVVRNRGSNRMRFNNNGRNREGCNRCTDYCSENRQICARPEGVNDPDQFRGFPSTCHMDCFNVCRRIRYEKVADGRCGRFRDNILPLGSNKKLTRIELNKAQYEIADGDDIVLFSPLS